MDTENLANRCLLCGDEFNGNGDFATPNNCRHVFHLVCLKSWADIKINRGVQVTCPIESCLKPFDNIGVKKSANAMKTLNVIPVDQDWNCSICFNSMNQANEIGNPEVCNHHFCLNCLLEWSQTNTSCPLDRLDFQIIFVKNAVGGSVQRRIHTPQRDRRENQVPEGMDTETDTEEDIEGGGRALNISDLLLNDVHVPDICSICHQEVSQDSARCSGCQLLYHFTCLGHRRIDTNWRCSYCRTGRLPRRRQLRSSDTTASQNQNPRMNRRHIQRRPAVTHISIFTNRVLSFFRSTMNYRSSDDETYHGGITDNSLPSDEFSNDSSDEETASTTSSATASEPEVRSVRPARAPTTRATATRRRTAGAQRGRSNISATRNSLDVASLANESIVSAGFGSDSEPESPQDGRRSRVGHRRARQPASATNRPTRGTPAPLTLFNRRQATRFSDEESDDDSSDASDSSTSSSEEEVQTSSNRRRRMSTSEEDEEEPVITRPKRRRIAHQSDSDTDSSSIESATSADEQQTARNRGRLAAAHSGRTRRAAAVTAAANTARLLQQDDEVDTQARRERPANRHRVTTRTASRQTPSEQPSTSSGRQTSARQKTKPKRSSSAAKTKKKATRSRSKQTKNTRNSSSVRRPRQTKKHRVVKKARRRKKASDKKEKTPSRRINNSFANRTESTDTLPRLSLLGEGRFPSGSYDVISNDIPGPSTSAQDNDEREEESRRPSTGPSPRVSSPPSPARPADPAPAPVEQPSSFLSSLLASQSRLFTLGNKYTRVNTTDGSFFSVDGEEDDFWRLRRQAQLQSNTTSTDEPQTSSQSQTGDSNNETASDAKERRYSEVEDDQQQYSEVEDEQPEESVNQENDCSQAAAEVTSVQEDIVITEESDRAPQPVLEYSPVVEASQGISDVESTPRTDISSCTALSGVLVSPSARRFYSSESNSSPGPSQREGRLERAEFGSRLLFEAAVAAVAKPVVSQFYATKQISKQEYKDQLRRIVKKVNDANISSNKISDIINLAKKCMDSYLRHHSQRTRK